MLKWCLPLCGCYAADMFMWGGGVGWGNNVLVTTPYVIDRYRLYKGTQKDMHLAVEVWKCQRGPVQKDRENDETNVSRPAVWKDMHFLSRRDHVGTNQISTLGKRGIYKVLSKNGWIWIHFFWSILGFPRRAQQSFSIGIYSVFSMSPFQTC